MLLAIDAGNTNTVFAVFDDTGAVRGEWRASTRGSRTADEYSVWLGRLLEQSEIEADDIHAVIIATVVPSGLFDLRTLSRKYFGCEPLVIGDPGVELGIEVKVDRPQEVGADRLVNAVAAHDRYGGPLVVVDFGTATTFDVIGDDGAYLGGVISPGINLSIEALHQAAAQLPRIAVEPPPQVIGTNTVDAMRSGVFWGYIGLIEGIVGRIEAEHGGGKLRVIATGGLAPLFAHHAALIERADPDLTLHGLLLIHRRNVN